ncbi:GxxExxY protein [Opitutaceae bacterium TAV4]|nr:GxxExxY protein [Opitutaceae bacterium TAV4]RRK01875.1 GxxExxY protein [Opitutaceae bacterium TAV3]
MRTVLVPQEVEHLATAAVNTAFAVHQTLGPGLLEDTYRQCMAIELSLNGITVEQEKSMPLTYRGHLIANSYRLDLLLNNKLTIELKTVESVLPVHEAQLITYIKLLHFPLGLLINFNVPLIKHGIKRILNHDFQTEN